MKISQSNATPESVTDQLVVVGEKIARLRIARRMLQGEAAVRANISRGTASLIEKGSPRIAVGQIVRYIDAIAPGKTLANLMSETDPSVIAMEVREMRHRARQLSPTEMMELDF